jgi:molecular chaperone GrpE
MMEVSKKESNEGKKAPHKKLKNKKEIENLKEIQTLQKEEIDSLQKELEAKKKEAFENHDKWLRLCAEFDNFKKRMQREKTDFIKYAGEKIVRDLLPIMDDLDRAIMAGKENHKDEDFIKGIEMVVNQIINSFKTHGAKPFDSLGQIFDPNKHQAVSKISTADHEDHTVMEELRKGWMFSDRLIRPAMVIVAENETKAKDEKAHEDKPSSDKIVEEKKI